MVADFITEVDFDALQAEIKDVFIIQIAFHGDRLIKFLHDKRLAFRQEAGECASSSTEPKINRFGNWLEIINIISGRISKRGNILGGKFTARVHLPQFSRLIGRQLFFVGFIHFS